MTNHGMPNQVTLDKYGKVDDSVINSLGGGSNPLPYISNKYSETDLIKSFSNKMAKRNPWRSLLFYSTLVVIPSPVISL